MQRFDRLLALMLSLRSGRQQTAAGLASRLGVSPRTIYRDLDVLSGLGVPVYADRGRGGGIRLLPGYFLPPVTFATGEAISLLLGLTLLRSLRVRPFAAEAETAERKLLAALPERLHSALTEAVRIIGVEPAPQDTFHPEPAPPGLVAAGPPAGAEHESEAISQFARGVLERTDIRLRYRSPYRADERDITATPLGLFADRDRWYLVGMAADGAATPSLWRSDRVLSAAMAGPSRGPRPDFDVRTLLGRRWLRPAMAQWAAEAPVRIGMTTAQADRLRQDWYYQHADYAPLPDGRVLLTFGEEEPAVALELLRWLGPGAELIEPAAWRVAARADLLAMLASYLPDEAE